MKLIFTREVEWRCYRLCGKRVNIFLKFSRNINPVPDFASRPVPARKTAFGRRGELLMPPASSFSADTVLHSAEFGQPRSELYLMWRMRAPPFHCDNVVTIFAKAWSPGRHYRPAPCLLAPKALSHSSLGQPQGKSISKTSAESADHLRRSLQSQTYRSSNWTLCLRSNSLYSS